MGVMVRDKVEGEMIGGHHLHVYSSHNDIE